MNYFDLDADYCPHCNGYGSSLREESDRCTVCGGSGIAPSRPEISDPTPAFLTIAEIRAANRRSSQPYWFSPDTMRFFNTEVYPIVYGGRWFITADRMELDMPRFYTIREANADGTIDTYGGAGPTPSGGFQAYATLDDAIAACLDLEAGRLGGAAE